MTAEEFESKMNSAVGFVLYDDKIADLRHLTWSLRRERSFGSAGMFYKAIEHINGKTVFYKLSAFNMQQGEYGYESVYEIMASRVSKLLGFVHLDYTLLHARILIEGKEYIVHCTRSENYKRDKERRLTLETECELNNVDTSDMMKCYEYLKTTGLITSINELLVSEYIIDNRDIHGANVEILYDTENGQKRLAPIYDCGSSLLAPFQGEVDKVVTFDIMHDGPVNNFLISRYWSKCLMELKHSGIGIRDVDMGVIDFSDLACCFKNDGELYVDKCRDMVMRRYEHAEEILNS